MTVNLQLIPITNRALLIITGPDRHQFLQDLITNDIDQLKDGTGLYALLLSPQGRFLHDFIVTQFQDCLRLEVEISRLHDLKRLLTVYKLRSKVNISEDSHHHRIFAWLGPLQSIDTEFKHYAYQDPRNPALGCRVILPNEHQIHYTASFDDYDIHRLKLGVPDGSRDMQPDKAIPLEFNMDNLHAISWNKGCYLGQELTARTKHRGIVRKSIFPAFIDGRVPEFGTKIHNDQHDIGHTLSTCQDLVLCRLRTDSDILFNGHHALNYSGGTLRPYQPSWHQAK